MTAGRRQKNAPVWKIEVQVLPEAVGCFYRVTHWPHAWWIARTSSKMSLLNATRSAWPTFYCDSNLQRTLNNRSRCSALLSSPFNLIHGRLSGNGSTGRSRHGEAGVGEPSASRNWDGQIPLADTPEALTPTSHRPGLIRLIPTIERTSTSQTACFRSEIAGPGIKFA